MKTRKEFIKELEDKYSTDGYFFVPDPFSPGILVVNPYDETIPLRKGWLTKVYKIFHEWIEDESWGNIYFTLGVPIEEQRKLWGNRIA